jgi:uncharacterized membrane protein (Fun14 family)
VNRLLRDHGFGVALVLGIVSFVIGFATGNPAAFVIAVVMLVIGVSARPLELIGWTRHGPIVRWQQETAEELRHRLGRFLDERRTVGDRIPAIEESVESTVGRATSADARTATGQGHTNAASAITRPQSPDEFAETLLTQIIEPAIIAAEAHVNAPTIEHDDGSSEAQSEAQSGG